MSSSRKKARQKHSDFQLEETEPRLLFSADLPGAVLGYIPSTHVFDSQSTAYQTLQDVEREEAPYDINRLVVKELIVVDSSVADVDAILADLPSKDATELHIVLLDGGAKDASEALGKFSDILERYQSLQAVHLISDGAAGELSLAGEKINAIDLLNHSSTIDGWKETFTDDADFLIYGSDMATSHHGDAFVEALSLLSGTEVAASAELAGGSNAGGDWSFNADSTRLLNSDTHNSQTYELVFVDTSVENYQLLVNDLQNNTGQRSLEVVLVDHTRDGIAQITDALQHKRNVDAIHVVSHGSDRAIQFGSTLLGQQNLHDYSSLIIQWQDALSDDADVLFYGCDLASSDYGRELLQSLSEMTLADVSASVDLTGSNRLGGDWNLEYTVGDIDFDVPFSDQVQNDWSGLLDITSDLVLHLKLDESSGSIAIDSSATGNDGTLVNAPVFSPDSAVGDGSYDFSQDIKDSGANAYVTVADDTAYDLSGDFSIALWYNATSAPEGATSLLRQFSPGDGIHLYATEDGDLRFLVGGADGSIINHYIGGFVSDSNWHHVAATRSGDNFQMFLDGVANTASNSAIGTVTSTEQLSIGGIDFSDFQGKLDDVRVYTRALESDDVTELHATGGDISTGLLLHNTFESDASDSSGNNYDGTLTNGAVIDNTVASNKVGDGKVNFDGSDDYVDLSSHVSSFSGLTSGTISAWIYNDSISGTEIIFSASDSGDPSSQLRLTRFQDELIYTVVESSTALVQGATVDANISAGTWNHVAVTVDATGNKIYLNGVEQLLTYNTGDASSTEFFADVNQLDFMAWGVQKYDGSTFETHFDGFMDDGRIYNRALSASDIAALATHIGPQTYTVTNTNDSGAGSLRQAIIDSNANDSADTIEFDISGSGTQVINLASGLDTITGTLIIDATTQSGWVEGSFLPVVIDGNGFNGLTFSAAADNSEVRGLVVRDTLNAGIEILDGADGITVAGNWIGHFNSDGTNAGDAEANEYGVQTRGDDTTIGGSTAADRNVFAGDRYGVSVRGASTNSTVSGNYIGTDITGNALLGNIDYGIFVQENVTNLIIGGSTAAHGNVVAGASVNALGLYSEGVDNNTIQHNLFGVSADGTTNLGSSDIGLFITNGGDNNQIVDNMIAGASGIGISIDGASTGNVIQGNTIGTDASGTQNWGAGTHGIYLDGGASDTAIGGIGAGQGNVIAFSGQSDPTFSSAITIVDSATGNSVRGNSIYQNVGLGIDLASLSEDGVTANDAGDSDTGGNNLQNWAAINAVSIADDGTFAYDIDTTTLADGTYTIDFYASRDRDGGQVEGERYLGTLLTSVVGGNPSLTGSLSGITLSTDEFVTLITTDDNGNSSEFSTYAYVTDGVSPEDIKIISTSDGGLSINDDGGNDIYLVADDGDALLGGQTSLSFETQFSSTANVDSLTLLSYAIPEDDNEIVVEISSNGNATLRLQNSIVVSSEFDYNLLRDGEQHSLGFTWDGSNGNWAIYADGVLVDSTSMSGDSLLANGLTIEGGGTLLFGQLQDSVEGGFSTSKEFAGTLYNTRLFDGVRTDSQMNASFRSQLPYNEPGMLAQWDFKALSVDGVVTDSVSGNNLTINHTHETGFAASVPLLTLKADENAVNGTVVGSVSAVDPQREALISNLLAADPDLRYSAETNKFYKPVSNNSFWSDARLAAENTTLNTVNGQLVTIRSAEENDFVISIATAASLNDNIWTGGTDSNVEGQWRWIDDGAEADLFWSGDEDGHSVNGAYSNFETGQPNDFGSNEDAIRLELASGLWFDGDNDAHSYDYVVEWDAESVLDVTQALSYSIVDQTVAGAFEVVGDTGEIRVFDGALLDADVEASHSITVRATDIDSNTYDQALTITLNDLNESNSTPTNLSSGIELNTDGGNDAYLIADNGAGLLSGLSELTIETQFALAENDDELQSIISYRSPGDPSDADHALKIQLRVTGVLDVELHGESQTLSGMNGLRDGQLHTLAFSWDNTNGDLHLYLDGELMISDTAVAVGETIRTGGELVLGHVQNSISGEFSQSGSFRGTLYDVRVWDEVRSEAEISLNHQQKLDVTSLPSGLIANWQMDGFNSSNEVVDAVSANNLSIGDTGDGGVWIESTPVEDLHISENANNGDRVGFVVPSDPDTGQDVVSDGLFLNGDIGTSTDYTQGQTFGAWTVESGAVSYTSQYDSPNGGVGLELQGSGGDSPGAITQSLDTVAGRQYQLIFNATGDFSGGDVVKHLVASAAGESEDFAVTNTNVAGYAYEPRSMIFTAENATTLLRFASGADDGSAAVISDVRVIEIPQAISTLLNNDSTLSYDAATGKFYRVVQANANWNDADEAARAALLNGESGQLVTIRSEYENALIYSLQLDMASPEDIWLGATDVSSEGEFFWRDGDAEGDQFWSGGSGGSATTGQYANFSSNNPDDNGGGEDHVEMIFTPEAEWNDVPGTSTESYIIEWDANDVLSSFTFNLIDDAGGRFSIDSSTGEITVADGNRIDYEDQSSYDVDVQVTDAAGNSHTETMVIAVDVGTELDSAPTDLSSGIEINGDGGNDAYLVADDGGAILGGLDSLTIETVFSLDDTLDQVLVSYANSDANGNDLLVLLRSDGSLDFLLNGQSTGLLNGIDYNTLKLGESHHLAVSWDNTNGDWRVTVDGKLTDHGTGLAVGQTVSGTTGAGELLFGQEQGELGGGFSPADTFRGTLYDVRIWNEVLSQAELSLSKNQKIDASNLPNGLIADWQMELDGSNKVIDIVSGNDLSVAKVGDIRTWTNQSGGVTVEGNTLTYVDDAQTTGWNSQINSANMSTLGFTDDYTVRFTLDNDTNFAWAVGLGSVEVDSDFSDPEYAIIVDHSGGVNDVDIRHNGTLIGTYNIDYAPGGEFGFYVNGTTLEYQYDGVTFATDTITASTDWYVDTSFVAGTSGSTYSNQDDYSLSNFHVVDGNGGAAPAFIASTPVDDLHISEHANNGDNVGVVVPGDPDTAQDVVVDGLFTEETHPATLTTYTTGQTFGGWTVSGAGDVHVHNADGSYQDETPLAGNAVHLPAGASSAISQTLVTDVGRQYQIVFAGSGLWDDAGEKQLRVAVNDEVKEFTYEQAPDNWSFSDSIVWEPGSMTFTATSVSTELTFSDLSDYLGQGILISDVQVIEISQTVGTILNNDSTLSYDAATDKFYRRVSSPGSWDDAQTAAHGSQLNGQSGQLVTIRSAYENSLVTQMASEVGSNIWIGATDQSTEGQWRWQVDEADGDLFWSGDETGSAEQGQYQNWSNAQPKDSGGQDYARISPAGFWSGEAGSALYFHYAIEWNANDVLSNFAFSLTDDAGGRFAIDSTSGEITAADASLLDYESATSHSIDVQVTDAAGNSYTESMTIAVDDEQDAIQVVPGTQSINEDTTLTFSSGTATEVSVTDALAGGELMRVSLSVNDGLLTLSQTTGLTFVEGANGSGLLVIDGIESDLNAALDGMTFTPDANFNGSVTLSMTTALVENLEAHYTFDDGSANDQAIGISNNGTLENGASIVTDPERGQVLSLDGIDDSVLISPNITYSNEVTLSAWVNIPAANQANDLQMVLSLGNNVSFNIASDGSLRASYRNANASSWNATLADDTVVGTGWRHISYTVNTNSNIQNLYLDGALVGSSNYTEAIVQAGSVQTIGRNATQGLNVTNGLIDDARVYTRALSAEEVVALANDQTSASDTVVITVDSVNDAPEFHAPGAPTFTSHDITSNAIGAYSVATADIDADGDLDVLSASANDDKIAWYENDGSENFTLRVISTDADSPRSVSVADVDGDGDIDVLSASVLDDKVAWYENDGNENFTAHVIDTNADGAFSVTTADVDSDGNLDVLVASQLDDEIAWYKNDGSENFTQRVISTSANSPHFVSTADVDGDGDVDVLSASRLDDKIAWYENDGSGNFTDHVITTDADAAWTVATADVDGDGDMDVLSASSGDKKIAWYENDGSENFTTRIIATDVQGARSVTTQDVDGDGDMDVLSASSDDKITWYENDGSENFTTRVISADAQRALFVATADVDGDGDVDVLSASYDDDSITWYESNQNTLDGNPTFVEGGAAVVLDSDVVVFDVELAQLGNYDGATLTLQRNSGADTDDVFSATGTLTALVEGNDLIVNGTIVGTVTTNSGGTLELTFNSDAIDEEFFAINDSFDDGALATNTSGEGGGFQVVTNGVSGPGPVSEGSGQVLIQTSGTTSDNTGIVSIDSLSVTESSTVSVTWDVDSAANWSNNGIELLVQSGTGFRPTDNLRLKLGGLSNTAQVFLNGVVVASTTYVPSEVEDGFTATLIADKNGWRFTTSGLESSAELSGGYDSLDFVSRFDGAHVAATVQQGGSIASMTLNDISVHVEHDLAHDVMQQIAYSNTSDAPPENVQIDWAFSDGNTGDQGSGRDLAASGSTTVSITAINDAPVLDLDADNSVVIGADFSATWTEGSGPVLIADSDASLTDIDSTNLTQLTVTLTNLLDGGNEYLAADTTGTLVVASYDEASGVLSLTGSDTVANYQQVLRTVTYDNSFNNPNETARTITVVANDGTNSSNVATATITVVGTDDAGVTIAALDVQGIGPQVTINEATVVTHGTADSQSVALADDGRSVVVWSSAAGQDGDDDSIIAQLLDASGNPIGSEFVVNSTGAGSQYQPNIAMDATGNFVVVWVSENQDGAGSGIYAQRFSSVGVAQGSEFLVNTTTAANQGSPSVTMADNGEFVIAWSGNGTGDGSGVFAQRYNAAGLALGGEFLINEFTVGKQNNVKLASDSHGNFVATWTSENQDGSDKGVYMHRFDSDGNSLNGEHLVDTSTTGDQSTSTVAMNDKGQFAIVWVDSGQAGKLYLQMYNADGSVNGGSIQVPSTVFASADHPQVAIDDSGNVTVVWQDEADAEEFGIVARQFDVTGAALGVQFNVNTNEQGSQKWSAIAMSREGSFIVIFTDVDDRGYENSVEMRRYLAATTEAGGTAAFTFVLNTQPTNDVTISLSMPDSTEGTLSTSELTFTSANWNVAQTVTVMGVNDTLADGDISHTLVTSATSSINVAYNGLVLHDPIVANLSDDPIIDLDENSFTAGTNFVATWKEGQGAVAIADVDAVLSDPDSANLSSLVVTITNVLDGASEILTADTTGTSIVANYDSGTGTLTLVGSDSIANYEQVLKSITYNNTASPPDTTYRTILFVANDGVDDSNIAMTTVAVEAFGDWSITGDTSISEGSSANYAISFNSKETASVDLLLTDVSSDSADYDNFVTAVNNAIASQAELSFDGTTLTHTKNPSDYSLTYDSSASNFVDISSTGTALIIGDESTVTESIGFDFEFYSSSYSSVSINSNGYLVFGNPLTEHENMDLSTAGLMDNSPFIAAFWDDFDPGDANSDAVYVQTQGSSGDRVFIVQYNDIVEFFDGAGAGLTFQVVISEGSNTVELRYQDVIGDGDNDNGKTATIGISDGTGTNFVQHSHKTASVANGSSILFNATQPPSDILISLGIISDGLGEASESYTIGLSNADASRLVTSSVTTTIAENNSAPVISDASAAAEFTEQTPVAIAPLFSASDSDSTTLEGATLVIASNYETGVDELVFSDQSDISDSWDSVTGTLTLNGTATVADYQAAIRTITFSNSSDTPSKLMRSVDIAVTDGIDNSNQLTRAVNVTTVNDAPVAVSDSATAVEAGGSANAVTGTDPSGNVLSNDTDEDTGDALSVVGVQAGTRGSTSGSVGSSVLGSYGSITINSDGSYGYVVDNSNAIVQALRSSANTLSDTFSYTMEDASGAESTTQITLTIQGVNDAPDAIVPAVYLSDLTPLVENNILGDLKNDVSHTGVDVVLNGVTFPKAIATHAPNGVGATGHVDYAIEGATDFKSSVGITSATGSVIFRAYVDNVLRFTSSTLTGSSDTVDIHIDTAEGTTLRLEVDNADDTGNNDHAVWANARFEGGSVALAVNENASNGVVVGSVNRTDVDWGDNATYALVDDAGGRFVIDTNTGEIAVADGSLLDYETAASHSVVIEGSDGTYSTSQTLTIAVVDVVEPAQTVPGAQSVNEDQVLTFSSGNGNAVSVSDGYEGTESLLEVTLSVNDGVLNLSGLSGISIVTDANDSASLTFHGTESDINTALEGMTFNPDADFNGSVTLKMSTSSRANLEANYTFETASVSGSTVNDQSAGGANPGTLNGNAAIVSDVERGDVLSLDGDGDYVKITGLLGEPADVTLAAWIDVNDTAIGEVVGLGNNAALRVNSPEGAVRIFWHNGTSFESLASSDIDIGGQGWVHVAATFDDSNSSVRLYVNGVQVNTTNTTDSIAYDFFNNDTIIGRNGSGNAAQEFDGLIDDVRIYSRVLSDKEVASLALSPTGIYDTVDITVAAVNDEEVLAANVGATVAEGSTGTVITAAMLNTTDVDNTAAQLVYTVNSVVTNGTLLLSGTALGVNDTFTQADIDAGDVIYDHDSSQTSADSFAFTVDDGAGTETSGTFSIAVTNVNDAPDNTVPGAQTVNEDTPLAITGLSVTDDDDNLSTVQLTVNNGALSVTLSGTASITAGANDSRNLTLSGSLGDINAALATVNYQGDLNYNGSDTLTVLSTDSSTATTSDAIAITVNAVNDNPTNAGTLPGDITVTEDAASNVDLSALNLSDVDTGSGSLIVTLTTATGGELTLAADGTVSFGGTDTARTITGTLTNLNNYFNTASNITYIHGTAHTNGNDADTIQVVLSDQGNTGSGGGTNQDLGTINVDIVAVNDEQVLATNAGTTIVEGTTGTVITAAMLNTTDVDNTAAQLVYTVNSVVTNGTLLLSGTALGVNDTFTQADIDAGDVTYDHDGSQTSADSFAFTVDDGAGTDSSSSFDIIVNDVPVITSSSVVDVEENQNVVLTVTSDDVDSGASTYSIVGGPDGNRFSIDELSGDLTFVSAPDFESPEDVGRDNVYNVKVQVADRNSGTGTQEVSVSVIDVNEAPSIATSPVLSALENQTSVATITAVDVDDDELTFAITGGVDATQFSIDGTNGNLIFNMAPDFESNANYEVEVTATDNGGLSAAQLFTINVANVNEAPEISDSSFEIFAGYQGTIAQLVATDPDTGDQLVFQLVTDGSNPPPSALTLSEEGVLNTGLLEPGDYKFSIKVIDSAGGVATAEVSLTVEFGDSPEIGAASPEQPDISTGGMDNESGEANQPNIDSNGNENTEASTEMPSYAAKAENVDESGQAGESIEELSVRESIEAFLNREPFSQLLVDAEEDIANAERQHAAASSTNIVVTLLIQQFSGDDVAVMGPLINMFGTAAIPLSFTIDLVDQIDLARSEFEVKKAELEFRQTITTSVGAVFTASLSVGFATWVLQSGLLVASAMSSAPLWRSMDPMPILAVGNDSEDDEFSDAKSG